MDLIFIIIGIIAAALAITLVLWYVRSRLFRPTADKRKQLAAVNAALKPFGFAYRPGEDYFYSLTYCWQRNVGYCKLYDEAAPAFAMIMHCEPIPFTYAGKRWLIELWKGQYGITTGAEIGVYNTTRDAIQSERFNGTFYDCASDEERLPLAFTLRKNGKTILRRRALHWWLTGFKLGEFSQPEELVMDAKLKFPNRGMCQAFVDGLRAAGYAAREYAVFGTTVHLRYANPHTPQPKTQEGVSRDLAQFANESNCKLYRQATAGYADTLDQLEYLKALFPTLYDLFLKALYSKAFYKTFAWLLELVYGRRETDGLLSAASKDLEADSGDSPWSE